MMKRTFAVLMAMVMLASCFVMLGTPASAAELKEGIFTYVVEEGKAKITAVDASVTGTVELPATLGGYPVTTVGKDAFLGCRSFDTLIISSNITKLERHAFTGCYGITSVIVPSTVESFEHGYTFSECKNLYSITMPKSITDIGDFCFDECFNLTDVWYEGTEEDRAKMTIHGTNGLFTETATWHYNSCPGEHTIPSTTEVQKATCTQLGLKKGTCTACGHEVTIPSAPTAHNIESYEVRVKANCKRSGTEIGTCKDCGQQEIRNVPSLGHSFGEAVVTKEATTTETGVKTKTCATCGDTEEEVIPVLTEEPQTDDPSSPTGLIIGIAAAVVVIGAVVAVVVIKKKKA